MADRLDGTERFDSIALAPYEALRLGSDRDAIELVERAIPIVRELGTPYHWMLLYGHLGLAALMTGGTDVPRTRSARSSRSVANWWSRLSRPKA